MILISFLGSILLLLPLQVHPLVDVNSNVRNHRHNIKSVHGVQINHKGRHNYDMSTTATTTFGRTLEELSFLEEIPSSRKQTKQVKRYTTHQEFPANIDPPSIFPTPFQSLRVSKKGGDKILMRLLKSYLYHLYPEGKEEIVHLRNILKTLYPTPALLPEERIYQLLTDNDNHIPKDLSEEEENELFQMPYRTKKVGQVWFPIECRTLGMSLHRHSTITVGRRNRVYLLSNSHISTGVAISNANSSSLNDDDDEKKVEQLVVWKVYENADEYASELAFFTIADHPNIVRPICIMANHETGEPGLVMEYVRGGSSLDFVRNALQHGDEMAVRRLSAQVYSVLIYMHWLGYIHADFKPENVVVDEQGNAMAIDFGFAIPAPFYKHYRGTPTTLAPELVKAVGGPILENIDFWALGSTIAQWYGIYYLPADKTKSTATAAAVTAVDNALERKAARITRRKNSKPTCPNGPHHPGHKLEDGANEPRTSFKKSRSRRKRPKKWVPLRISKSDGYSFGQLPPHNLFPTSLRQLMFYCLNPEPTMRMWSTKKQLEWFEGLPFWDEVGIDWKGLGVNYLKGISRNSYGNYEQATKQ